MKVEAANINSNNDQEEQQQQMETDDAKTAAKEPQQQQSTTPPAAAGAMPMQLCKANFLSLSVPIAPSNANSCSRSPLLVSPMPSSSSTAAASSSTSPPRRKASAPVIGTGPGQIHADCLICSDRATGKHYGSISCDGCKGFFRRTIRKKHNYVCRFSRNCVVDKSQRNSCRRCRFDKCLANGMRPEAVQLERDRIAATRRSSVSNGVGGDARTKLQRQHQVISQGAIPMEVAASPTTAQSPGAENGAAAASNGVCAAPANIVAASPAIVVAAERQLQRLMDAERTLTSRHHSALLGSPKLGATTALASGMAKAERTAATPGQQPANFRTATTGDVTDSMHQQLILLVEWAKQLEEFRRLPLRSQIALLRHFSAQHLVLCAAFRSLQRCAGVDAVWLANDRFVPRDAPKIPDVNRVVARILDHLTGPMRHLHLEEREFVALKAVAFFDPMAKDVENCAVAEVEETRRRILGAFEHHVTQVSEHRAKMPLRLANLLLLLPPLMAIARDLVEEAQLAKLFGLANVDELMAELLLPEDAETRSYSRLRTSVTSSIVQSNVTSPTPPNTPHHSRGALLPPPSSHLHHHHHSSPLSPIVTAGSPQASTWVLAAPTPIYSPGTPFSLIGVAARSQQLSGGADRADKR